MADAGSTGILVVDLDDLDSNFFGLVLVLFPL